MVHASCIILAMQGPYDINQCVSASARLHLALLPSLRLDGNKMEYCWLTAWQFTTRMDDHPCSPQVWPGEIMYLLTEHCNLQC